MHPEPEAKKLTAPASLPANTGTAFSLRFLQPVSPCRAMQQASSPFGYSAPPSPPRVIRLRALGLEQVHHVLTPSEAWLDVHDTVESLLSTGRPCRNRPCIGAEELVDEVLRSMGELGRYYRTLSQRDPRMEACCRLLQYGEFLVLGRAFDRIVDVENDAGRPEHRRWIITRFGSSEQNAHALLRHVEQIERRERAWKAAGMLPPIMVTPNQAVMKGLRHEG